MWSMILVFLDIDLGSLRIDITSKASRRTAYVLFFLVAMILMLWLPEIVSLSVSGDESERLAQDGQRTYVITALDLGLLVPIGLLSGLLMLR
ncbi:MAG: hypothetical protein GWN18_06040, partial [Thermoplasmata archaeon]|nr:hypothetical protein [Thermoplasmata archaeon]NIU48645.1 hypothetical protein [Thermoplasmata archaeon]NIV78296.1 hypothetical protein [Thermoplasmata archaeon]NIW82133.1 hypothetical protein [Thermoplasmata archaeon]